MSQRSRSTVLGRVLAILALLLASLATFLVSQSASDMAAATGATQHTHAYGLRCAARATSDAKPERGPRPACAPFTTNEGVDPTLHVCSACSGPSAKPVAYTYSSSAGLAQDFRAAATTRTQSPGKDGAPSPPRRSGVAANAGTRLGWSTGDDIYSLTKAGNKPAWSTVRGRFWKNEASSPQYGSWTDDQLARMRTGRAPQRYNPDKGGMESMDLSHEPIPFRDGGTSVIPRWPQDHAAVDPFRHPGY